MSTQNTREGFTMTQDLTKINSPFGLLDVETREALKEAERNGKVVQRFTNKGWLGYNGTKITPGWIYFLTYRIKPD